MSPLMDVLFWHWIFRLCLRADQTECAEDCMCAIMLKIHLLEPKTPERVQNHNRGDKQYLRREQIRLIQWVN